MKRMMKRMMKKVTSVTKRMIRKVKRMVGIKQTNKKKLDCVMIKWSRVQVLEGRNMKDVAKDLGVSASSLSRALSGKTYKNCADK